MTNESARPLFRASAEVPLIEEALQQVAAGSVITYEQLNDACKSDVRGASRSALRTARKRLESEQRIAFDAISGVGLKRLENTEIVGSGQRSLAHIRRTSKRAITRLACADYERLPQDARYRHDSQAALYALFGTATRPSNVRRIEAASVARKQQISRNETLELFKDGNGHG
jgi:hypothetical protein